MRVYNIDSSIVCTCGHEWETHHHGAVQNPKYLDYPLTINGLIAEECEYIQRKVGYFTSKNDGKFCKCGGFKPIKKNIQKLVDDWVRGH